MPGFSVTRETTPGHELGQMKHSDTPRLIFDLSSEMASEPTDLKTPGGTSASNGATIADAYDEAARAVGWFGPELAFGLLYEYVTPGEKILDLGIGTGLASVLFRKAGLEVFGLDNSEDMLDASRSKGFKDLARQDLSTPPYPYAPWSFDHAACIGVLPFIEDPSPVFMESTRLLNKGGTLVFTTLDRAQGEASKYFVQSEQTVDGENTSGPIAMYRHSTEQVEAWVNEAGLVVTKSLLFTAYRDRERTQSMQAKCFLARRR